MNHYINFKNKKAALDTFKLDDAKNSTVEDIIVAYEEEYDDCLTVDFTKYIVSELLKIDIDGHTREYAMNTIFSELDFVERICRDLDIEICDYPDLRDYQHDYINEANFIDEKED
jgi:hypothetical protein